MLLHDVKEAVALLGHGRRPFLGAARELFEQVGHYVVQTGAAACTDHRICREDRSEAFRYKYFLTVCRVRL